MAKKSMIAREVKRKKLVDGNQAKRELLKKIIISQTASDEEKMAADIKLQKMPRDSSPVCPAPECGFCADRQRLR